MEPNDLQDSTTGMKRIRKENEAEQVSRKKKKVDRFAFLSDDLLLVILKKLPADILRYKTKFVCKRWFSLITNRILLDHASLILENASGSQTVCLMDISEDNQGLTMKDQKLEIPHKGRIKSWCNEFLLITDLNKIGFLYVYNIITKQGSFLPKCSTFCGGHYGCRCGVGLSYDKFKKVYKVVHVFLCKEIQCELLTLNGDIASYSSLEWKKIGGPHYKGQRRYYWYDPVSVQGRYFHWDVNCSKYLVSMDTVKERFRQTWLPGSGSDDIPMNNEYSLVEIGGFLSLLHKVSQDKINIWMLKDYQRSKWENLQSINISSYMWSSVLPVPVTCVESKRYIIFRKPGTQTGLYSYDLKNKVMRWLNVDVQPHDRCVVRTTATTSVLEVGSSRSLYHKD